MKCPAELASEAQAIWRAGVDAVRAERLVGEAVSLSGSTLSVCGESFELSRLRRIAVVGAGKAGSGMAAGVETALGEALTERLITGWVNVPADCVRPLRRMVTHPARPAGVNEPTEAGCLGARRILDLVGDLGADDLCLVLISGGGSALLPAPIPQITLADKLAVTRLLMRSGATIHELNAVRTHLSLIKGGGLRQAIRAGHAISLIISDVIGDPLDIIASGPTLPRTGSPAEAAAILERFGGRTDPVTARVCELLRTLPEVCQESNAIENSGGKACRLRNVIIGNNAVAVAAAQRRAESLGYRVVSLGSDQAGVADDVGRDLARRARQIRAAAESGVEGRPVCLLSGGEPVVHFTPGVAVRKGGRNQQLALAALCELTADPDGLRGVAILAGGTDGEDGPTDAAGACVTADVADRIRHRSLDPAHHLHEQNAYPLLDAAGALLKTGPTHTNVMDLRVALIDGERGA